MTFQLSTRALALTTGLAIASSSILVPQFVGTSITASAAAADISNEDLGKYSYVDTSNIDESFKVDFKRYEAVALMREVYQKALSDNYYTGNNITPQMRTSAERELWNAEARQAILLMALEGNEEAQEIDVTKIGKDMETVKKAKALLESVKFNYSKFDGDATKSHRAYIFDHGVDGLEVWIKATETNGTDNFYGVPVDDDPLAVFDHGIEEASYIAAQMDKIKPPVDLQVVKTDPQGGYDEAELASAVAANKELLDDQIGVSGGAEKPLDDDSLYYSGEDERIWVTPDGNKEAYKVDFETFESIADLREVYAKALQEQVDAGESNLQDAQTLSQKEADLAKARLALAIIKMEGFEEEVYALDDTTFTSNLEDANRALEFLEKYSAKADRLVTLIQLDPSTPKQAEKKRRAQIFKTAVAALKKQIQALDAGNGEELTDNPFAIINRGAKHNAVVNAMEEILPPIKAKKLKVTESDADEQDAQADIDFNKTVFGPLGDVVENPTTTPVPTAVTSTATVTPTQSAPAVTPTATVTPTQSAPAVTPTATVTPTQSAPAVTPTATVTPTQSAPAVTPTATGTPTQSAPAVTPTATGTPTQSAPAVTPTATGTPTQTQPAVTPTATGTPTQTQPAVTPTATGTPTQTQPAVTPTATGTPTQSVPAVTPTATGTPTQASTTKPTTPVVTTTPAPVETTTPAPTEEPGKDKPSGEEDNLPVILGGVLGTMGVVGVVGLAVHFILNGVLGTTLRSIFPGAAFLPELDKIRLLLLSIFRR